MIEPRFIQIHTLHSYTGALLNRDDSGLAKRLPYGGVMRTRVSSQCLKRHWRLADDPHAIHRIEGATAAFRSRQLVTEKVFGRLDGVAEDVLSAIESIVQKAVYGDKGDKRDSRQTLLFGEPELDWIARDVAVIVEQANGDPEAAKTAAQKWASDFNKNIKAMRESARLPAGLTSALFGRMVTSDPEANIDAPVHVAHAITVHEEETESDYFTAIDDLKRDDEDAGADTIQETELSSGLFYGYVVVDVPGLVMNTTGGRWEQRVEGSWRDAWKTVDRALAADVLHNLIYLIAEISPGAKLGSTAPYGRAELMLIEAGNRQPRSLAAAFRDPAKPQLADATEKLRARLQAMDDQYATGEARRSMTLAGDALPSAPRATLPDLAQWARAIVLEGTAA